MLTKSVEVLCQFINSANSSSIIACGNFPTADSIFSVVPAVGTIVKGRPRKRCRSKR